MDELGRRLHDLAGRAGPTTAPPDLGRRVRRRRRLRAGAQGAGGLVAAGLLIATAFGVSQLTAPDVPPADTVAVAPVPASCADADLLTGPAVVVQGESAAQRFSLTLSPQAGAGCTLQRFRVVGADETERARADLTGVDLDPGDRVDLVVRWDAASTCGTAPVQVRADDVPVGSLALPVCGDVSLQGDRVPG